MSFVYPWFLLLLFLVLFFYGAKKSSKIEQVFSKDMLSKLQFGALKGDMKYYLLIVSFCFMVVALARPVIISEDKKEIDVKSFNFVIALDISKSMEAKDIFPNRLEFGKKAIEAIMQRVPEANIAVIAYTNDAFLVSPFSNDFKSIKFLLSNLDSNSLSSKGSQILSALEATNRVFESTNDKKKSLVLVGDGADGRDLEKIKEYVNQNNITLHVLSIGTKKGSTLSDGQGGFAKDKDGNIVISKRDDSLSSVLNGGAYLSTSGELSKLNWFVDEIKNSVDKKEVKRDRFKDAKELFYYPLTLSLFLLFFAFNALRVPFLVVLLFVQTESRAEMFDFVDIYKAKKSYEKQEYKKAEEGFAKVEAKYNEANALYKQKKYKEALKKYESIDNFSGEEEYRRLHNIGNSYANLNKIDEAIKSYEKALKLKDDEDTKANLEYMKKKKKEQKKKDNKKKDNKKKDNKKKDDKKKDDKKSDGENENKNKKKSKQKEEKKSQEKAKKEQKKMSEAEAKKWEKRMDSQKFKTKPMRLKKGEQNEIYW